MTEQYLLGLFAGLGMIVIMIGLRKIIEGMDRDQQFRALAEDEHAEIVKDSEK